MKLIARIALRLHEIGAKGETDAQSQPEKSVAIFRVLGHSPDKALKALDSEIASSCRPLVALVVPEIAMTAGQAKVYAAVVSACRSQSTRVYACGGDHKILREQMSTGGGVDKWYASVPAMVQAFGETESRAACRKL